MANKTLKQISNSDFMELATSVHSISNKYIKIENVTGNKFFYVKKTNDFGDCSLMKFSEEGYYENIGNIFPVNKRFFAICFVYEGFSVTHKIKFSDVKILSN